MAYWEVWEKLILNKPVTLQGNVNKRKIELGTQRQCLHILVALLHSIKLSNIPKFIVYKVNFVID